MKGERNQDDKRYMGCPDCGDVASVPTYTVRPICVHDYGTPEIWDANDTDGEGRPIEWSPNEEYRQPGKWWQHMVPIQVDFPA